MGPYSPNEWQSAGRRPIRMPNTWAHLELPLAVTGRSHLVHFALLFGIPAIVLTIVGLMDRSPREHGGDTLRDSSSSGSKRSDTKERRHRRYSWERTMTAPFVLAALSAGAGIAHAFVISDHFREFWLFGLFFVAAAGAQLTWAGLILRNVNRNLIVAGGIGNAIVVLLWVASRTTGLPLGPERWQRESVGVVGIVATAMELALVGLCFVLYRRRWAVDPIAVQRIRSSVRRAPRTVEDGSFASNSFTTFASRDPRKADRRNEGGFR